MLQTKKSHYFTTYKNLAFVIGLSILLVFPTQATGPTQFTAYDANRDIVPKNGPLSMASYELTTSMHQNHLIISYTLPDVYQTIISNDLGQFTRLEIPHASFTKEYGKPQLPFHQLMLAVPTSQVSISLIDKNIKEIRSIGQLYPAQPPQTDAIFSNDEGFVFDTQIYTQNITFPSTIVSLQEQGFIRDIPFIKICINPVQYNPKQATITIYDTLTIQISWTSYEPLFVDDDFTKSPYYPYYESIFSNWHEFKDHTTIIQSETSPILGQKAGCEYLIITHPTFTAAAETLATWKDKKGIPTKVVDLKKTGSSAENIRTYIQNAYDTWTTKPSYILLIGDVEFIPTNYLYIHPYHGSETATDLWYVTVEGEDHHPDMFIGRLSVDTLDQAYMLVDKIIEYEQSPPILSTFYHNITVAAYFQDRNPQDGYEDRRFVKTSEEIRDYLLPKSYDIPRIYYTEGEVNPTNYNNGQYANGDPLPSELLKPGFSWDGNYQDISNAIEQGTLLVNHRDHGFTYGWGDPYYDITHIEDLTNGNLLPIVFSMNCCSGQFDTEDNESFCEVFIQKNDGGAVGVIGASRVSYSGYNDYLCRGFFDAIWPDFDTTIGGTTSLYRLGQVLNYGKTYLANTWGSGDIYERITFEMFHWFGDPTMEIWTAVPQNLIVDYPHTINSSEGVTVTVTDTEEHPIQGAMVCISNDRLYGRGLTDNNGIARFETIEIAATAQPRSIERNASLVVSIHNYIPYEAVITASMDIFGDINGDGIVNIVDLLLLIISWGTNPGFPADLDGNGVVNFRDLFIFIINWK